MEVLRIVADTLSVFSIVLSLVITVAVLVGAFFYIFTGDFKVKKKPLLLVFAVSIGAELASHAINFMI